MKASPNFWPAGIIAVFVVFFAGMASVVVIAATHRDSLVSANYYEQELKFQEHIEAAARAGKSGAGVRWDAATGKIFATVPRAQLQQNFSGKVSFYRANAPDLDREVVLAPGADGIQSISAAGLVAGPWRVRLSWTAGGQDYFLEEKITL